MRKTSETKSPNPFSGVALWRFLKVSLMFSDVFVRSWTQSGRELREMTGVSPPDGKDIWGNPTKLLTRWRDAPMSASGHRGNYWQSICLPCSVTQHTNTQNPHPHVATDWHTEKGRLVTQSVKTFVNDTPAPGPHPHVKPRKQFKGKSDIMRLSPPGLSHVHNCGQFPCALRRNRAGYVTCRSSHRFEWKVKNMFVPFNTFTEGEGQIVI